MSTEEVIKKDDIKLPVNQEWLAKVINEKEGTCAKLAKVNCEILGEGKGFVSVITKAILTWEASNNDISKLPKSVAIKIPTLERAKDIPMLNDALSEEMLRNLHNQEVNSYTFFTKYPPCPFPMAKCYYAEKRTDDAEGVLITEVVEGQSLTFSENNSFEKAIVLAEHIANVQAYGLKHPDCKDYFSNDIMDMWKHIMDLATTNLPKMSQMCPDKIKINDEDIAKLADKVKLLMPIFLNPAATAMPLVVCFGDLQHNNILWKVDKEGKLTNEVAALLDFQGSMMGTPADDFANVLCMGCDSKIRKAHGDQIFEHYYDCLKEKVDFELGFSLDDVRNKFREHSLVYCLMGMMFYQDLPAMKDILGLSDERVIEIIQNNVDTFEEARDLGYV